MWLSLACFLRFPHVLLGFLEGLEVAVPDVWLYLGGDHSLGCFCLAQGRPFLQQTHRIIVLCGLLLVLRRKGIVIELPLLQFKRRLEVTSFAVITIIHYYLRSFNQRIRSVSARLFLLIAGLILRFQVVLLQRLSRHLNLLIPCFFLLCQQRDPLFDAIGSPHDLAQWFQ